MSIAEKFLTFIAIALLVLGLGRVAYEAYRRSKAEKAKKDAPVEAEKPIITPCSGQEPLVAPKPPRPPKVRATDAVIPSKTRRKK